MSRRNLIVLTAALAVAMLCIARTEPNPYARQASRGYQLIDEFALEDPTDNDLFAGAMRGMVDVLKSQGDQHSAYIEPREADPLLAEMRQEFGGIGVRIQLSGDPPKLTIVEPPEPGTPAFDSEIRAGDVVLAVDKKSIDGLDLAEVLGLMRGAPGEPILLSILHEDAKQPVDVRLVREIIQVPSVIGDTRKTDGSWRFQLEEEPRIAQVRITTFGNRTVEELSTTIDQLIEQDVNAFVLDVRNNSGGALDAAVGVAELFLPSRATILSTRGRGGVVLEVYATDHQGEYLGLPLAVLIDRNTASASEIVAAALQDHGVATVVGERSFGKGTVQQLLPVDAGRGLLKLTSASYWRPSGVNIHRKPNAPEEEAWGVKPDDNFSFQQTEEELIEWLEWRRARDLLSNKEDPDEASDPTSPLEQDAALGAAVTYLKGKLSD